MNCCQVILRSGEHLQCERFKRWQTMTIVYRRREFHTSKVWHLPQLQNLGQWKSQNIHIKRRRENHAEVWIYRIYCYLSFLSYLRGPFSSRKYVILVFKLLTWQVRGASIFYRIASSLAWLINTSWKARLLWRMVLHPKLLDKWKISCAGRLVMIVS